MIFVDSLNDEQQRTARLALRWLVANESLRRLKLGAEVVAFSAVRDASLDVERKRLKESGTGAVEQLRAAPSQIDALKEDLTRANAETEQWMSEYEVADEKAKICGQQLRSAQYRNQQLLAQIKARGGEPDTDVKLPDDWDGFADWCDDALSGRITLSGTARGEVRILRWAADGGALPALAGQRIPRFTAQWLGWRLAQAAGKRNSKRPRRWRSAADTIHKAMIDQFFARPILNSPYAYPARHWGLDASGQPTGLIVDARRRADFITPIPKPRKKKGEREQASLMVKALRPERDALEIQFPRVQGYRVELPEEQLETAFNDDHHLVLTPDLVGPSITRNAGIIGEAVDLNLEHLGDMRPSTLLMHLTKRLLYTKWRDPGEEPRMYLFGQLKRITREWLETRLTCKGDTYPAQLMYQELADMACERITKAITAKELEKGRVVKAILDPYNPTGSTAHVRFNTAREHRWETLGLDNQPKNHVNWVILDSDWEAEFCRVAESHPKVLAYTKNHNLGLAVPYRFGSTNRIYIPDFIVQVDDDHGAEDPLNLIVEIKGYRREDAKEKKSTMDAYWIPCVNLLGSHDRWAFAEFGDVYEMQDDFAQKVQAEFDKMLTFATKTTTGGG